MASSIREAVLARLAVVLADTAGVYGKVFRSRADAYAFDQAPCISVDWREDERDGPVTYLMERQIAVRVAIFTRGDLPDQLADPIAVSVHDLIMADVQLGGKAIDTTLGSVEFLFETADKTGGRLTHEYIVRYRHSHKDMTA